MRKITPRFVLARQLDRRGWHFVAAERGAVLRGAKVGAGVRILRGSLVEGNVEIEDKTVICRWSVVQSLGGWIRIGARSSVGDFCNLYGQGGLLIGRDVLMASGVRLMTAEHTFESRILTIREQPEHVAPTVIGNGAWLASNCVVLSGVTVGTGAIVAAGAVVTRDVDPFTVVAGIPARVLRERP